MPEFSQGMEEIIRTYSVKLLLAFVLLVVGLWLIKFINKIITRSLESRFDKTLIKFLTSLSKTLLMVMLLISIASTIGIQVTSFVAVLGALSFAIGLALQGSLANFAGGVLLLIFKPFVAEDYVEMAGHSGTVKEIQLLYTIMATKDNKKVFIPNGSISNDSIINYSAMDKRRIDLTFGVGYESSIKEVKEIINNLVDQHDLILKKPEPIIRLGEHAGSSLNFHVKIWVKTTDYWSVFYDLQEQVKIAFDEADINIPFPQLDVHFAESLQDINI